MHVKPHIACARAFKSIHIYAFKSIQLILNNLAHIYDFMYQIVSPNVLLFLLPLSNLFSIPFHFVSLTFLWQLNSMLNYVFINKKNWNGITATGNKNKLQISQAWLVHWFRCVYLSHCPSYIYVYVCSNVIVNNHRIPVIQQLRFTPTQSHRQKPKKNKSKM